MTRIEMQERRQRILEDMARDEKVKLERAAMEKKARAEQQQRMKEAENAEFVSQLYEGAKDGRAWADYNDEHPALDTFPKIWEWATNEGPMETSGRGAGPNGSLFDHVVIAEKICWDSESDDWFVDPLIFWNRCGHARRPSPGYVKGFVIGVLGYRGYFTADEWRLVLPTVRWKGM